MGDLISRQALCEYALNQKDKSVTPNDIMRFPSAQIDVPDTNVGEMSRRFVELLAEYHDPEICPYKEYKGKPYFSIKYMENGEGYVGYGTYSPKVMSGYLREYFMPSAPEIVRCKDCKHRDPEDKKCDCGHDILWQLPRRDDWFCADSERRTDEQTISE